MEKIVINVTGQTDLDSTIKKLVELGVIDEKNAKQFEKNNKEQQGLINQLQTRLNALTEARNRSNNTVSIERFNKLIDESKKKLSQLAPEFEYIAKSTKKPAESLSSMDKIIGKIGPALAGAFAVSKIVEFGRNVVDTTAKFQKFSAVLTNTLGSKSAAHQAIQQIVEFASQTPFGVEELTSSFVKLANQGFVPTREEMRKLGDLASSTGKSFDQLTEAIIDAQTGEFERLKEFGIRASKEGDKVKFTFKGVETQTEFTSEAIRKYVLGLGDVIGVSGSMAAISRTLGGQISNLGDSFDQLLVALGDRFQSTVSGSLEVVSAFVDAIKDIIEIPLSEKLQEEQTELNALVTAITDVNASQEVRNSLIAELQQKYPDFLKDLNAEVVTNEELKFRLEEVNKQYINRIVLQKQQEKFEEQAKNQAKALEQVIKAEKELGLAIVNSTKYSNIQQKSGESNIEFGNRLIKNIKEQSSSFFQGANRTAELSSAIVFLEARQRELNDENQKSTDILKEKVDLEKRLGITTTSNRDIAAEYTKEIEAQKVTLEKLKKELADLEKQFQTTDENDKERLLQLKKQILATKEHIKAIEQIGEVSKETKKLLDAYNKAMARSEFISKHTKDLEDLKETEVKASKERIKLKEIENKELKRLNDEALKREYEKAEKEKQSRIDAQRIYTEFVISSLITISNAVAENNRIKTDNELHRLDIETDAQVKAIDERNRKGLLSDEAAAKQKEDIQKKQAQKELELRRKQAQRDKEIALFQIAINTASAILKAFAQFGPPPSPAGIAAAATAVATGGIEAAIVSSRPLPQFKKGGYTGDGNVNDTAGIVHKQEFVMPADKTAQYKEELQQMYEGRYLKDYREPIKLERSLTDIRQENMADSIYKSILLNGQFDDKNIVNAISKNNKVKLANSKELAKMIGETISDRSGERKIFG